jgi:hypothetical protein
MEEIHFLSDKLVLNLKTAKALGLACTRFRSLTFPQTLIVSADELVGV